MASLIVAPPTTVAAPDIAVFGGPSRNIEILNDDTTPWSQDGTDFGRVAVNGVGRSITFRASNVGITGLTLSAAVDSAEFTLAGLASEVLPGSFDDFTVQFTPTSEGPKTARIRITNNDPLEDPYVVDLQGFGALPPFQITQFTREDNNAALSFESTYGETYQVVAGQNLRVLNPLAGFQNVPGSGFPITLHVPVAVDSFPVLFYRVERLTP